MSEFSELIKNFDKVRDYMRDFFIYGYKTRSDFQYKSLRTYDNEKRRIESWLGSLIQFDTSKKGKQVSISLDSRQLSANPLYKAYKSKSFTDNDIRLHFFLLDLLNGSDPLSVEEITDMICNCYGEYFEPQTIRLKLREYVSEGIILQMKCGKAYNYRLSEDMSDKFCSDMKGLSEALKFYSETSPFGVVGSYLMDQLNIKNETFLFKHNYIVHTLEDNILLEFITAIDEKRSVEIVNFGKQKRKVIIIGVPLKVFVSTQTGRRYIVMYLPSLKRFTSFRLDYIKSVKLNNVYENFDYYFEKLEKNAPLCWGISFGTVKRSAQNEQFKMVLHIDEKNEQFALERLMREGRNGIVERINENTFAYSAEVFDTNEMMNWVKTFIGRIISVEGTNKPIIDKFYRDISRMKRIYSKEG